MALSRKTPSTDKSRSVQPGDEARVTPVPRIESIRRARSWRPSTEALMLLPAVLLLAAISIYPFLYMIRMSFSNIQLIGGISMTLTGTDNWTTMLSDSAIWESWLTTIKYVGGTLIMEMVLGIGVALAISNLGMFRNLALTLAILPMFIAPAVVGLLGLFLTNSTYGLYAYVLHSMGLFNNIDILGNTSTALPALMLMDVWEWTPLIVLIVAAGLSSMPHEPLEAASIDGANAWQRVWHVVLPMVQPTILVALLIRSMDAIRYFDIIWVTTAGGPADTTKIIPIRLYETAFRFFNLGYAAAIGLSMLVVTIILGKLFVGYMTRGDVNVRGAA